MTANVGSVDRAIRIIAGLALIAFGLLDQSPWRYVGVAGVVLILTGLVSFCPAYTLLGIRTCRRPAASP